MEGSVMAKQLNIRPTTSVYATYKNIKYDPWTAIAEFVDNSTQSYYDHATRLESLNDWNGLNVNIIYDRNEDGDVLIIKDNAYGMNFDDFQRAIILDSPPPNPSRCEFGMGLKTAACWFGLMWRVESTELGSSIKYSATIDVEALQKYQNELIAVEEIPCSPQEHGTVITIWNLNHKMSSKQIGKTKDQLRGMYRVDLRTEKIHIYYNDESLQYQTPEILEEILPNGSKKIWRKDVSFNVICNCVVYPVKGFIALLQKGSTSGAGLTLIRRGRVIVGGYQNGYRPEEVFEKSNSFVYQRLFGELNMDAWPVTQTKDSFDWYNGLEDLFIEKLLVECDEYRKKAKEYRKPKISEFKNGLSSTVQNLTNAGLINDVKISDLPKDIIEESANGFEDEKFVSLATEDIEEATPPKTKVETSGKTQITETSGQKVSFEYGGENYTLNFIWKNNNPDEKWLNIFSKDDGYIIEWNIQHPFIKQNINDPKVRDTMQQFIFALALAEIESRRTSVDGKIEPGAIRIKMNEALKTVIKE